MSLENSIVKVNRWVSVRISKEKRFTRSSEEILQWKGQLQPTFATKAVAWHKRLGIGVMPPSPDDADVLIDRVDRLGVGLPSALGLGS
eukprot:1225191-Rhodomonas_salina.2